MQEKNRNHRPQGAGQPPHHMIYIYIYMVDTPKQGDANEAMQDIPPEKQSKHMRHRRCSKPRHSKNSDTSTRDDSNPDGAEDENNPAQPGFE